MLPVSAPLDLDSPALSRALAEPPHLTLTFYSFGILLRQQGADATREYAVRPEDLAAALSRRVAFDTGLLTPHTLAIRSEGAERAVAEFRPAGRAALWLEGSESPVRLPLPALVLVRRSSGGRDPNHHLFAVAERPTSYDAPLYLAPLPNVYSHGGVCWGTVTRPAADTTDLSADWAALFGTPFGSHSVGGKCKSHPDDVRKLYLDLEQRRARRFPAKELIPARRTLGDLMGVPHDPAL